MNSSTDTLHIQAQVESSGSDNALNATDVAEIRRFAEGKTRIIDLTETLASRPTIDPFADFIRVDETDEAGLPTTDVISRAWSDLEEKLGQVIRWQDERDDIEEEATCFEVGDMERLRKVAKAATEREMSTHDTDLIEITIQTFVALDTLLRLLKSRRDALDILQGRLRWEESRKDCWTTYTSLKDDLDDFVKQARWSPQIYQKTAGATEIGTDCDETNNAGASTSDWSPLTARSSTGLTTASNAKRQGIKVKTQSIALQRRCSSFVNQVVPLASKRLDDLIEQRQVPDAFLDEQDRLEDLAESIKEIEVFMIQLSLQWRKADDIYRQLRSLHIQGKQLSAALSNAQREAPTDPRLADFMGQRDLLQQKWVKLCGEQVASAFISDSSTSAQLLSEVVQQDLPQPTCEPWSDQERFTIEIQQVLAKETTAAAKHLRSAYRLVDKYERGLHLYYKSRDLRSQLTETKVTLLSIGERVKLGRIEQRETAEGEEHIGLSAKALLPNLSDRSCLDKQKYNAYIEGFPFLRTSLDKTEEDVQALLQVVDTLYRDCVREGLLHSLYRREIDEAIQEVRTAQREARSAVEQAASSLDLLKRARALNLQLGRLEEEWKECLYVETNIMASRIGQKDTQTLFDGCQDIAEVPRSLENLARQVEETSNSIHLLSRDLDAIESSDLRAALLDRKYTILGHVRDVQENHRWLKALEGQVFHLKVLEDEYKRLTQAGLQVKALSDGNDGKMMPILHLPGETAGSRPSTEPFLQEAEFVCKEMNDYVSATHSDVVLCGPVPDSLLKALAARSSSAPLVPAFDEVARQSVNEWCSLLSTLKEEIVMASKEAQQRHHSREEGVANIAAQQEKQYYDDALERSAARCDVEEKGIQEAHHKGVDGTESSSLNVKHEMLRNDVNRISGVVKDIQCRPALTTRPDRSTEQASQFTSLAQGAIAHMEALASADEDRADAVAMEKEAAKTEVVTTLPDGTSVLTQLRDIRHPTIASSDSPGNTVKESGADGIPFAKDAKASRTQKEDQQQKSDPLPMPSKYARRDFSDTIEDVFGPVPLKETLSMPQIAENRLPAVGIMVMVRNMINQRFDSIVEDQIQPSGKLQYRNGLVLPTVKQAAALEENWKQSRASAELAISRYDALPASESDQLRNALQLRDAKIHRYSQLAAFAERQSATEKALSNLLDVLDQSGKEESKEEVQKLLIKVTKSIDEATLTAEPILTDVRVRHQLSQLRHSYQDMAAMAKELRSPEEEEDTESRSDCPSRLSSGSSLSSLSGSGSDADGVLGKQRPSLASLLMGPPSRPEAKGFNIPDIPSANHRRILSSSSGTYATASQSTPRQSIDRRVVSEGVTAATPSRIPLPMSRSTTELSTPRSMLTRPSSSSSSTGLARLATRTPISASKSYNTWSPSGMSTRGSTPKRVSSHSTSSKPNQYRANPKSKLDVAVGKIVNKLPMPVNITHASVGGGPANSAGSKAKEQWHDESGRYWVGQPDPKLCFCRILRSRTVMVRVGGGWQELTTYILKHFSHLGNDSNLSLAASPNVSPQLDRGKTEKLPWISSATLSQNVTPTNKTAGVMTAELSPESAFLTPVNERDEQGGSASFRSARRPSSSANTSPSTLTAQFEKSGRRPEDMHGMWIRRERQTSQNSSISSNSRTPSMGIPHLKEAKAADLHHARSTLASRNRVVSSGQFVEPRRRVESLNVKDEGGGTINRISRGQDYSRVRAESISLATNRRQSRIAIPARFSPALS